MCPHLPDFLPRAQPDGVTLGHVAPLEAQLCQSPTNTWGQKEEEEIRIVPRKKGEMETEWLGMSRAVWCIPAKR